MPADDGGIAIRRDRHRAATHQLATLLRPYAPAARVYPRAIAAAHDGGVAIPRDRHRLALLGSPDGARADQLGSLLGERYNRLCGDRGRVVRDVVDHRGKA